MSIARYLQETKGGVSPWRLRFEELKGAPGLISFAAGDPDLDTPLNVQEAATAALAAGHTHYAATQGLRELRQAVQTRYATRYGIEISADQVLITKGAANGLFTVITSLVQPGDRVVICEPSLSIFGSLVDMAGGIVDSVGLTWNGEGFSLDLAALSRAAHGAKMIIVNFPNNPTGFVLSPEQCAQVVGVAAANDAYLLSDEVYDEFIFDGSSQPTLLQQGYDRTIVVNSFSKTYAMTGWRLGYVLAAPAYIPKFTRLFALSVSHTSTPVQWAGVEALSGSQDSVAAMVGEMKVRRDALYQGLLQVPGLRPAHPEAGLYVFCNVSELGMDDLQFCDRALEEQKVFCYPGRNFGAAYENFVRFSFAATPLPVIQDAVSRLQSLATGA